jgi:anti-anti-sigma factor
MAFEQQQVGSVQVIRPLGRLDSASTPELDRAVRALLDAGTPRLLFDLSQLDYISSTGLRVLLLAGKTVRNQQGRMVVSGVRGMVREVFEMSGLPSLLTMAADQPAALALLEAP